MTPSLEEQLRIKDEQCAHLSAQLAATTKWLAQAFPAAAPPPLPPALPTDTNDTNPAPANPSSISTLPPILTQADLRLSPTLLALFLDMKARIELLTRENAQLESELEVERFDPDLGLPDVVGGEGKGQGKAKGRVGREEKRALARRMVQKMQELRKENDELGELLSRERREVQEENVRTLREEVRQSRMQLAECHDLIEQLEAELESTTSHLLSARATIRAHESSQHGPSLQSTTSPALPLDPTNHASTSTSTSARPTSSLSTLSPSSTYFDVDPGSSSPDSLSEHSPRLSPGQGLGLDFGSTTAGRGTGRKARRRRRRETMGSSSTVGLPGNAPGPASAPQAVAAPPGAGGGKSWQPPRAPQAMLRKDQTGSANSSAAASPVAGRPVPLQALASAGTNGADGVAASGAARGRRRGGGGGGGGRR